MSQTTLLTREPVVNKNRAITANRCAIRAQSQQERRDLFAHRSVASAITRLRALAACELGLRCILRDSRICRCSARARRHRREFIGGTHFAKCFEALASGGIGITAWRLSA